jgi:hypothetical protein
MAAPIFAEEDSNVPASQSMHRAGDSPETPRLTRVRQSSMRIMEQ